MLQPMEATAEAYDKVFASTLKRSIGTAECLSSRNTVEIDPRLAEIDYGDAEGLTFGELKRSYPHIVEQWDHGHDPPFPNGERQADVALRLESFLRDVILPLREGTTLVVTHNVVLRVLLGKSLGIPMRNWFRIQLDHLESFRFRVIDGVLIPAIKPEQRTRLRDQAFEMETRL